MGAALAAKSEAKAAPTKFNRNRGQRDYGYQQAHRQALKRHQGKPKAVRLDDTLKTVVAPLRIHPLLAAKKQSDL